MQRCRIPSLALALIAGSLVGMVGDLQADQTPTFRSRVDAVELNVAVTRNGKPVQDLTAADFRVTDNGVAQTIVDVTREATPMDVTVAVDTSQHLSRHLVPDVRCAVARVRGRLRPVDTLSLVTFDEQVHEQTPLSRPADVGDVAIESPSGREALYDALDALLAKPWHAGRRQVVVLFTDGFDNASRLTTADVLVAARRSHAVVVIISRDASDPNWRGFLPGEVRAQGQPVAFFRELAAATGGVTLSVPAAPLARPTPNALTSVINHALVDDQAVELLEDIRASYFVRYQLTGIAPGGRHDVDVSITRPGANYVVRTRKGYLGSQ
jgi:VWFA-related protein